VTVDAQKLISVVLNDNYRIERLIGRGGMGAVFEVTHLRLDHRMAAKLLSPHASADQELAARFDREAKITAGLRHPHIVEVTDFNRCDVHGPYLVMELLRGEDLGACLRREKTLDLERVDRIFSQIAAALEVAHQRGVVHRDLKPGNIFLCDQQGDDADYVKVLDFGIAKVLGDGALTQTGVRIGTSAYMSPEQAVGAEIDWRTDQFACASLLYHMLAGRPPFVGDSDSAVLYQIEHKATPSLTEHRSDLPEGLDAVFAKAMQKEPRARYASIKAFYGAFHRAFAGAREGTSTKKAATEAVEAPTKIRVERDGAPARASSARRTLPALAIAALLLAGIVSWAVWGGDPKKPIGKALPDAARSIPDAKAVAKADVSVDQRRPRPVMAKPMGLERPRPRKGTQRKRTPGLRALQEACAAKKAAACKSIGRSFERTKNPTLAIAAYLRACELGDKRACVDLGRLYQSRGEAIAARFGYLRACELKLSAGCNALGELYLNPNAAGDKNVVRARKYFARACEGNSARGCVNLARLYCPGGPLPPDAEMCKKQLKRGCRLRDRVGCKLVSSEIWKQVAK